MNCKEGGCKAEGFNIKGFMRKRSQEKEWMDFGLQFCSLSTYHDCLWQLDRIGRFLGGDRAAFKTLSKLQQSPKTILDVGCGGGLFTLRLAERYPDAKVVGIDLSEHAISFANEQKKKFPHLNNVEFHLSSTPELKYEPGMFDVVMATLVCHHLSDQEIANFLKDAYRIANRAVIINDLHRHPVAYLGFGILVPFLFPNRMIFHDGLLSVKRAFKQKDWQLYFKEASIPLKKCSLKWHWAFRWMVSLTKDADV